MPDIEHLDVPLEASLRRRLAVLAKETDQEETILVREAITHFLELRDWQRGRIEKAVAEADRGEFATSEEVERVMNKYKTRPQ